ncbi:MAG: phosphopentomutase [Anaerorhabdus sp.]
MSRRAIVIVLDSFGIGEMSDVATVRPQDCGANTVKHLLEIGENIKWDTLIDLGLINALGEEVGEFKKSKTAVYGKSNLDHQGGDTYFGHQEIMGTKPMTPTLNQFQNHIDSIEKELVLHGNCVDRIEMSGLSLLCVNGGIFIGDNLETDPGQAINVTGSFDLSSFEEIKQIGEIVRKHVQVSRVIAFGGTGVSKNDLVNAIEVKGEYIGINAPKSKVYRSNYQVAHIGYGVNTEVQLPNVLDKIGIKTFLYGKVADIVMNPNGKMVYGVDTEELFKQLHNDLETIENGFFCLNVQETDLAGHQCNPTLYIDRVNASDKGIKKVLEIMSDDDLLVVMADHGNDPTTGNSKHSREMVPLLIHYKNVKEIDCGERDTLADVGATIAEYFETAIPNGTSFLQLLK